MSNTLQRLSADDNFKSLLARTELIQMATVLQLQTAFQDGTVKPILSGHSKIDRKGLRQMVGVNEGRKYCRML